MSFISCFTMKCAHVNLVALFLLILKTVNLISFPLMIHRLSVETKVITVIEIHLTDKNIII